MAAAAALAAAAAGVGARVLHSAAAGRRAVPHLGARLQKRPLRAARPLLRRRGRLRRQYRRAQVLHW